jgi:ribosomal protein S18 acetylase RimI-like enzyme
MLNFYRITDVSDPLYSRLYNLYSTAFPPAERRSWEGLEHEVIYEKHFYPNALLQNDEFVGIFNYWTFEKFCYLEHFAVNPNLRNQHIGSEAMKIFKEQTKLPIILEVEMPNNPLAGRRIKFYERLGFTVMSHDYAQPPYENGEFLLPVIIMCNNIHFANTHFEKIKETLYHQVYHYKYDKITDESTDDNCVNY